jgi:hypothetical protein
MTIEKDSLYNIAKKEILRLSNIYLNLIKATVNFENLKARNLTSKEIITIILSGKGSHLNPEKTSAKDALAEWERRKAIPFDIETSITTGVYYKLRKISEIYLNELEKKTSGFKSFNPEIIQGNPYFLPFLQHIGGIFSKSKLKEIAGSVNDTSISKPSAKKLSQFLQKRVDAKTINKGEILTRLGGTLEGIVRDLVGRILLENIVESALTAEGLIFQKEDEYKSLSGVVYDFRADFVLPNAENPKVFIEVRKSSSRHASLYAKDKMFSAVNWKGKNKELLGVWVVDGSWTAATLDTMTKVFDYVVPISSSAKLAKIIAAYLKGDKSKLKRIITFRVENKDSK